MNELEEAIKKIREQYEEAKKIPYIDKPVVYALYKTWKALDEKQSYNNESKKEESE